MNDALQPCGLASLPRVLFVDDEKPNLDSFCRLFRRSFVITVHQDPHEALRLLPTAQLDVVLSDFRMPAMDGLDFLARCRQLRPDLPRALVTAAGLDPEVGRAVRCGAIDALIHKPWPKEQLILQVRELVERVVSG